MRSAARKAGQPASVDAVSQDDAERLTIGKPCPFCQGTGEIGMAGKLPFVVCMKCCAGSEPAPTVPLAIANWGKRVRAYESRPSTWFPPKHDAEAA